MLALLQVDDREVLNGVLLVLRGAPAASIRVLAELAITRNVAQNEGARQRVIATMLAVGTEFNELWAVSRLEEQADRLTEQKENEQRFDEPVGASTQAEA